MKLKNILLLGLGAAALASCNDYLDVNSPSSYNEDFVFGQKTEVNRALNGVYAEILDNSLYGNAYQRTFIYNTDVDMQTSTGNVSTHNSYARYDCDDQGSEINSFWTAAYRAIEYANRFISALHNSPIYDTSDSEIMQMEGEAKCLRAMVYHDLVVMFGDVPFSFSRAAESESMVYPVTDREEIQKTLISDLKAIAPYMSYASSTTVERASKEYAWSLIARIALTAGGYSLHPDKENASNYGTMQRPDDYKDFYQIAKTYTDSVIRFSGHSLNNDYKTVFVKECNFEVVNDDDPIFEIPFAKESTGNTGYIQGPTSNTNEGTTLGANTWGEAKGNGRLSAFYRYAFDSKDKRREFLNGLWYYDSRSGNVSQDSCMIRADYTVHNNKWSKLWATSGSFLNTSTGSTGINFPYMRYADVLLMNAEAINELEGPTTAAQESLRKVRARAFDDQSAVGSYIADAATSKDKFLKAVLDERKLEFAGENSRWRDLVRNNMLGEEVLYSFLRYLRVASDAAGLQFTYDDALIEHDGADPDNFYLDDLPLTYFYEVVPQSSAKTAYDAGTEIYGYPYPNTTLDILHIFNPYDGGSQPSSSSTIMGKAVEQKDCFGWGSDGVPNNQCRFSFYGYVRYNDSGSVVIIKNGQQTPLGEVLPQASELPPVRYILPYPNAAIQRSAGQYKNYYGY